MHEVALAQGMVDLIVTQAAKDHFRRARVVHLEIGALATVMPEALEAGFEAAAKGTLAEGARLAIQRPPGQAWCLDCQKTVEVESRLDECPTCAGVQLSITGGATMRVLELEVE